MDKRDWVKSVRKKLPDDLGDCPTLPQEMLDLLTSLMTEKGEGVGASAGFRQALRSMPGRHGEQVLQ